jgi:hypothetical protein
VGQITAHSNPFSSFSSSSFPLCVRRGFDKKFCIQQRRTLPRSCLRTVHSASCGLPLLLQPPAHPLVVPEDAMRAQARPHQGEPLVRLLLHRNRHPLWVVPANDHVLRLRRLADRHARPGDFRERLPRALEHVPLHRWCRVAHTSCLDPIAAPLPVQDWYLVHAAAVPRVFSLMAHPLRSSAGPQSQLYSD